MRREAARRLVLALLGGCAADPERDTVPAEYAFLFRGTLGADEREDRLEALPYERIELEYFSPWSWGGDVISLWRDGRATMTDEKGRWLGKVIPFDYGRLCWLIEANGLSAMEPCYAWEGFDAGTKTVRVWPAEGREAIEVSDYGSVGPLELWAIQAAIDGVARTIRWEEDVPADGAAQDAANDR